MYFNKNKKPNKLKQMFFFVSLWTAILTPWILGGTTAITQLGILALGCFNLLRLDLKEAKENLFPFLAIFILTTYVLIQFLNPSLEQTWIQGLRMWELQHIISGPFPTSIKTINITNSPIGFIVLFSGISIFVVPLSKKYISPIKTPNLIIILSSFFLLAAVGIIFRAMSIHSIFGLFDATTNGLHSFFGTFIYKNHAAAYLNLGLSITLALILLLSASTSRHQLLHPSILTLLLCSSIFIYWAIIFSKSRFGFLCATLIVVLFVVLFHKRLIALTGNTFAYGTVSIVVLLCSVLGGYYISNTKSAGHLYTLNIKSLKSERSLNQRLIGYQAELEMFKQKPIFGWGAGSFQYGFKLFQNHSKEQDVVATNSFRQRQQKFNWQHAHNDYLEFLIELGIVGTAILFSIPGYFFWIIFKSKKWKEPFVLMLLAGLGSTMLHAVVDFPFRNPAVLLTWFTILVVTAKYCSEEKSKSIDKVKTPSILLH